MFFATLSYASRRLSRRMTAGNLNSWLQTVKLLLQICFQIIALGRRLALRGHANNVFAMAGFAPRVDVDHVACQIASTADRTAAFEQAEITRDWR
jgi:hypothetical protein